MSGKTVAGAVPRWAVGFSATKGSQLPIASARPPLVYNPRDFLNKNGVPLRSFFTSPHAHWLYMKTTTLLRSQGTLYPALYRPLHPRQRMESTENARKQQGNKWPLTTPAPELLLSKRDFVGNFSGTAAPPALRRSKRHEPHRNLPDQSQRAVCATLR